MSYARKRSYHDLSPEEKRTYDGLRAKQRTAVPEVLKKQLKDQADAMLGLSFFDDRTPGAWRARDGVDREPSDPGRRIAGTSKDFGHQ